MQCTCGALQAKFHTVNVFIFSVYDIWRTLNFPLFGLNSITRLIQIQSFIHQLMYIIWQKNQRREKDRIAKNAIIRLHYCRSCGNGQSYQLKQFNIPFLSSSAIISSTSLSVGFCFSVCSTVFNSAASIKPLLSLSNRVKALLMSETAPKQLHVLSPMQR